MVWGTESSEAGVSFGAVGLKGAGAGAVVAAGAGAGGATAVGTDGANGRAGSKKGMSSMNPRTPKRLF